jgi:N-acetylmuramoyl-L-alanine amidase
LDVARPSIYLHRLDLAVMRSIAISSGHSTHCQGAAHYINEVAEATKVVDRVHELLSQSGVIASKFHDTISNDSSECLNRIVDWHNAQNRELDVSCHFNASQVTSNPVGCEVWWVTQQSLASAVSASMAAAGGFKDRGQKYSDELFFLNNTDKPAILLEVCFVDSSADVDLYYENFAAICHAIAESISGAEIGDAPPERPQRPQRPDNPYDTPMTTRPTLGNGDANDHVSDLQRMLNWTIPRPHLDADGDFGDLTETAVRAYQSARALTVDGICGEQTWTTLYNHVRPMPRPPQALSHRDIHEICLLANNSRIADYSWKDRGVAPQGFTQGMALAFAQSLQRLNANHPVELEMSKARTDNDKDVFELWRDAFEQLGMPNEQAGIDALRHLFAL